MPIDPIPKSLYPVVPQALGVPALLRSGAQIIDTITLGKLGISDALASIIGAEPIKWGVFDIDGNAIADYDSVFATEYRNESRISDYPIEQGSFSTYNKVDNPFDVMVILNCGGDESRRATFLAACERVRKSRDLYTVMTPEYTLQSVNFYGMNYRRSARDGAYMLSVELLGREVREKNAAYSSPKDPGASDAVESGMVQSVDDPTLSVAGVA